MLISFRIKTILFNRCKCNQKLCYTIYLMQKIILFYKFVLVPDPETTKFWQNSLCQKLGLKGRIIISDHGINGTLGGAIADVKAYIKNMNLHPSFKGIEYKWSDGKGDDFPKLSVKVRKELVTLAPDEDFDVFDKGTALRPKAWHKYLADHPDVIVFDARNDYESAIGKFKGAITPAIKNFRDVKTEIEKLPKDKPVLTYCTGDIRCEYLSAYMKHKGFKDVYHLDGGIVKYGQEFGDEGFWEGKCYVFDNRISLPFSEKSKDIGVCVHCESPTSNYINCGNVACNRQVLVCDKCQTDRRLAYYCSQNCLSVGEGKASEA